MVRVSAPVASAVDMERVSETASVHGLFARTVPSSMRALRPATRSA